MPRIISFNSMVSAIRMKDESTPTESEKEGDKESRLSGRNERKKGKHVSRLCTLSRGKNWANG